MKYIFFRVDSSYSIASGHLVRCQRLAKQFSKKYEVIFLINKFHGNFNFILKGFKKIYLNRKNDKTKIFKNDSQRTIKILKNFKGKKILIVDHYYLNNTWHKKIIKYVDKLVCINDYIKKNYCDYLINESYFPTNISQKCLKKNTKLFIGPKYALIDRKKKKTTKQNGIFVFFGSVDEKNITLRLCKILKKITDRKIYIIIGAKNKSKKKILSLNQKNFYMINKYVNLSLYLNKCNLAIIAGGSVVWEALYNKIRTVVIPTAINQHSNIRYLKNDNIIQTLALNKLNESAIRKLLKQKKLKKSKTIVDGDGIKRIYKELIKVI